MSEYVLAKYIRLSSEDLDTGKGSKTESNSVANQRNLLDDFISRTPDFMDCEVLEFCDDGWSGTNFDRPAVREMLKQAEAGKVHCIIVKDFSRFGRNHLETGDYLEQKLPGWGVRFISLNDAFDSNKYRGITGGIDIAFRNLVHDLYSRDLSDKVRSARIAQARKGGYISAYAFYGYTKDNADKRRLVIDEDAAQVVRLIFDLAAQGLSTTEIARKLNSDDIPTPRIRKKELGVKREWHVSGDRGFWEKNRVRSILKDERYAGKLVACKQRRYEVGKVQAPLLPSDEWIVVPDAFPPIVSGVQFDRIQERLRRGNGGRKGPLGKDVLFYRKIKCGVCKKAMVRGNTRGKNPAYSCESKNFIEGLSCMDGGILESEITGIVLCAIRQQAAFSDRAKSWMDKRGTNLLPELDLCHIQIEELNIVIQKTGIEKISLWEKWQDGSITREDYIAVSEKLSGRISGYEESIKQYEDKVRRLQSEKGREILFVERFARHTGIQKLTREIVDELVQAIYVYDCNRIEIVFNYTDEYAALRHEVDATRRKGTVE